MGWGWGLIRAVNKRPSAGEATLWPPSSSGYLLLPLLWSLYSEAGSWRLRQGILRQRAKLGRGWSGTQKGVGWGLRRLLLHCHQPGKPGLSGGHCGHSPFRGGFSSGLVNYSGPASGPPAMTMNASREGRISGGSLRLKKLSRQSKLRFENPFHSLLGFPEGQVGVPRVATEPEAASV